MTPGKRTGAHIPSRQPYTTILKATPSSGSEGTMVELGPGRHAHIPRLALHNFGAITAIGCGG